MLAGEARTNLDIFRDLLEALKEREWIEIRHSRGCNCCRDEWETECSSCGAPEGYWKDDNYRQHKPDCKLAALILEAETFIRIEEQLEEEREMQAVGT